MVSTYFGPVKSLKEFVGREWDHWGVQLGY